MITENKVIKFSSDTKHRKQWFTGLSFSHPAKMSLPLQLWLIDNFTKEGETILDPMAGSGTLLVACSLGRNVICVELESKFVDMMKGNWEKIQQRGPQMGYKMGTAQILQGDARNLTGILVDKVLFSPPFSEQGADKVAKYFPVKHRGTIKPSDFAESNIQNLPYGSIDAVISSPPYEGSLTGEASDKAIERIRKGVIDGSITGRESIRVAKTGFNPNTSLALDQGYSKLENNIGNLKSTSYLEAMLAVYQQCWSVLKPQGLMVLVTKNFIRNKQIVRLDLDTIKLCEQSGFLYQDRWYRELTQQSFWRVIYKQRFPDAPEIKYEDILVFKKLEY